MRLICHTVHNMREVFFTAIKVGVRNLETDLFTNVNKPCPSCDRVLKPLPNLCMSCVQAWALLVHWNYCLSTSCTLSCILLGHSLYTTQVLLGYSLCTFSITICALLVHQRDTVSVLPAACLGTYSLPTNFHQLVHHLYTIPKVVHLCLIIQNVIVNRLLRK